MTNTYNTNGTLATSTNEISKQTSYIYDDYKRLISITRPPPTQYSYNYNYANTTQYNHADSNPYLVTLPSGKQVQFDYDNNNRGISSNVSPEANADPSLDQAITTYTYDNNGNLKTIKDPNGQTSGKVTTYYYDQQNRLTDVDDRMVNDPTMPHKNSNNHTASWTYDQANNTLTERRSNDQVISYAYDAMNHVHQTTVPQTPNPTATTVYDYDATGLMQVMHDPNGNLYSYDYDFMGRKTNLTYPTGGGNEGWTYDLAGNVRQFTNRSGNHQVFSYDGRERLQRFDWDDTPRTPSVEIGYDAASRPTQIKTEKSSADHTAITTINNTYFDDNTLHSQEEWAAAEGAHRIISYKYDVDLNRDTVTYPDGRAFQNIYTTRSQLWAIDDVTSGPPNRVRTYGYDHNENLATYFVGNQALWVGPITWNAMDQMTREDILFPAPTGTRSITYSYDEMNNRTALTRDGFSESYGYDLNEQTTTGPGGTYGYDANGNRTGTGFVTNNLNEQTTFAGRTILYDSRGNLQNPAPSSSSSFDARNRLTAITVGSNSELFVYDGLNRKISQTVNGFTTYNVWDGWNLAQEYNSGSTLPNYSYVYGRDGLAERISGDGTTIIYYYRDGLGSTSHISDASGTLLEWYKYDRFGTVTVNTLNGHQNDVRHLFTGQLLMSQIGLYDYRFRVYSPALMRFMQTDPISFYGDPANLYRYAGNSGVNRGDWLGLDGGEQLPYKNEQGNQDIEYTINEMSQEDYEEQSASYSGPQGGPPGGFGSGGFNGGAGEGNLGGGRSGGNPGGGNRGGASHGGSGGGGSYWAPFYRFLATPATPEQAAYTRKGMWPTVIVLIPVVAPFAAPETGLYLTATLGPAVVQTTGGLVMSNAAALQFLLQQGFCNRP